MKTKKRQGHFPFHPIGAREERRRNGPEISFLVTDSKSDFKNALWAHDANEAKSITASAFGIPYIQLRARRERKDK